MSARAPLRGGPRLRDVSSSPAGYRLRSRPHQRRSLKHFISKVPPPPAESTPPLPSFRLAVKDNIATTTAGLPTTCGSLFLSRYRSPFEATVVRQLRARGARVVGKTNLDEFGMGSHSVHSAFGAVAQEFPPSLSSPSPPPSSSPPSDDSSQDIPTTGSLFSAGGSSGGSAVAVQVGDADVALGTDTGGSVRLPAAYTGIVGYKPSYGMLSRHGVVPYANSLDTVGLLARRVRPIAELVMGIPAGDMTSTDLVPPPSQRPLWSEHDPKDPTSLRRETRLRCARAREGYDGRGYGCGTAQMPTGRRLRGLTFGIPLEYNIEELDLRVRGAWAAAARLVRDRLGARLATVSLPTTRHALAAYYVLAPAEASSNLAKYDGVRYGRWDVGRDEEGEAGEMSSAEEEEKAGKKKTGGEVLYARARARGFGAEVRRRVLLGAYTLSSAAMDNYFVQAQRVRRLVRRDFDRAFALTNPLLVAEGPDTAAAETTSPSSSSSSSSTHFDLSDLPECVPMADRHGPRGVDFLLCPTAPTLAPPLADVLPGGEPGGQGASSLVEAYMNDVFTVPASLAGLPAISIPIRAAATGDAGGFSASSSSSRGSMGPDHVGLQLIGQFWDDARLLAVAETVAEALAAEGRGGRGG